MLGTHKGRRVLAFGVLLILAAILLGFGGCAGEVAPAPPSRAEFQQLLMSSAAIEGGRSAFAGAFADLAVDAGCPGPVLYDATGTVRDAAWLMDRFGIVSWECAEPHDAADYVFRLVALREACGPAIIIVNVRDENGYALEGRAVVRGWPSAPALPAYDPPASRYEPFLGVVGWTSGSGDVGFGLGSGDYYYPETGSGASWVYIADYDGPSDIVRNLGMLGETEHCTLYPVFWRVPKEDVEPPTPTPGPTGEPAPVPEGLIRIEEFYIRMSTPQPGE